MRPTLALFGLCSLFMLVGCEKNWGFLRKPDQGVPPGKPPESAEPLVTWLNQNSQRVRSINCQDVDVEFTQDYQSFAGIRGKMACEQPRDFRMSATMMGKNRLDVGSNDREFWYWIADSKPPYQFFCSYEDLRSKQIPLPFPFQPEWVMETMGMANYPVNGRYQIVTKRDNTFELIQETTSAQGQPVKKVIVFNTNQMKNHQQIRAYKLRDMHDKEICSAEIKDVQVIDGAVVPYKIQLIWPAERLKLSMQLNKPVLNQMSPEVAKTWFARPPLSGIQAYDLASQARYSGGQVQPAGGIVR